MNDFQPHSNPQRGRLVVVVDDDPAVRDSTSTLLEHAGHMVIAFDGGSTLIEAGVPSGAEAEAVRIAVLSGMLD